MSAKVAPCYIRKREREMNRKKYEKNIEAQNKEENK
jgi:hypothetical protein